MEGEVSTVEQVERFEDYCLRKRGLEEDIEVALRRRDVEAVEAVELAEIELENTKGECADIAARVKVALEGNFERAEKIDSPSETRRNALWKALEKRVFPNAPNASSSSGNTDTSTTIDRQNKPKYSDHFEQDDSSDEFLNLLVERYTDICHERRTLQEEIEDRLERKERMAAERLRCAKIVLETTRQKAIEIVAALNEASGGDTKISLPASDIDSLGSRSTPISVDDVSKSDPRTTANSPQQNVASRPPHAQGSGGVDSSRPSNSFRQSSNHGDARGPPGTMLGAHGNQHLAPPPTSQQRMPPPPNVPGMARVMSSGAAVGAPRGPGQAPQFGQIPRGMGTQGIPPPMWQGQPPYPYHSNGYHHNPNMPRHF